MNILLALGLGSVYGWAIACLVAYLPRFAVDERPQLLPLPRQMALMAWLRGKPVPRWHWLSEGALALWVAGGILRWQSPNELLVWSILGGFLWLISLIDLQHRLILNVCIFPALALSWAFIVLYAPQHWLAHAIGMGFAFTIFYATALFKPDLGAGDVKLATFLGALFGFPSIISVLLVGVGLGAIVASFWLSKPTSQRPDSLAYAPFLCFGAILNLIVYLPILGSL